MLAAGKLRHRIVIESVTHSKDSLGGDVKTWAVFATVWAQVTPLTGKEFFESQRIDSELTTRIRLRKLPGVTTKMRVLFQGRILDIQRAVDVQERDFMTELLCRELPDA